METPDQPAHPNGQEETHTARHRTWHVPHMPEMKRPSRRTLLLGTATGVVAATGLAVVGKKMLDTMGAQAATDQQGMTTISKSCALTPVQDILNIALTAERLAVTFYTQGITHADTLGISVDDLRYLKAALIEEQLHEQYLEKAGGKALISTFSFPRGVDTFMDLQAFIATQQQLESAFESAYLAAVKEFGAQSKLDMAQIFAQIACVEAEHRTIGRIIGGLVPANNRAFTPIQMQRVSDIPAMVQQAGYISPKGTNSFTYQPATVDDPSIQYSSFFAVACQ